MLGNEVMVTKEGCCESSRIYHSGGEAINILPHQVKPPNWLNTVSVNRIPPAESHSPLLLIQALLSTSDFYL